MHTDGKREIVAAVSAAIRDSSEISAAFLVGSYPRGESNVLSDVDIFLYADLPNWTRQRVSEWLARYGLSADLSHWSGVEKHRLLLQGVRLDLSIRSVQQIGEVTSWPRLFFEPSSVIKDRDNLLAGAIARRDSRAIDENIADPSGRNESDGLLLVALDVLIQLRRGETLNARSRSFGVVEAMLRAQRADTIGEPSWREPSRRAEEDLEEAALAEARQLAFASEDEFAGTIEATVRVSLGQLLSAGFPMSRRSLEAFEFVLDASQ